MCIDCLGLLPLNYVILIVYHLLRLVLELLIHEGVEFKQGVFADLKECCGVLKKQRIDTAFLRKKTKQL